MRASQRARHAGGSSAAPEDDAVPPGMVKVPVVTVPLGPEAVLTAPGPEEGAPGLRPTVAGAPAAPALPPLPPGSAEGAGSEWQAGGGGWRWGQGAGEREVAFGCAATEPHACSAVMAVLLNGHGGVCAGGGGELVRAHTHVTVGQPHQQASKTATRRPEAKSCGGCIGKQAGIRLSASTPGASLGARPSTCWPVATYRSFDANGLARCM